MQVTIEPGMSFMGIKGTCDLRVLNLSKQDRALLNRAADLADKIRDLCVDENGKDTGWGEEAASMAMRAREMAEVGDLVIESVGRC